MPRHPDPLRKPQLVAEIIEHLLDRSLASASFRSISQALGFSTYPLVYHFGTKAQLMSEIVAAVSTRAESVAQLMEDATDPLGAYFEGLDRSWAWTLLPRSRQLQRLEFEAALIESVDPETHTFSRGVFANWLRIGEEALAGLGLPREHAELEVRLIVNTFYGIQYDYILNNNADRATDAYREAMRRHRERIIELVETFGPSHVE